MRKGVETPSQANQEKLKGYHDLAQACTIRGWQVFLLYLQCTTTDLFTNVAIFHLSF